MAAERPYWWNRHYIEPFTLTQEEIDDLIYRRQGGTGCHLAWVTKDCQVVACGMSYVLLDGRIAVTSTSQRDKIKAWKRNPSICLVIQEPGKQVTIRGTVELVMDPAVRDRFVRKLTASRGGVTEEEIERGMKRLGSPYRYIAFVNIKSIRSFNSAKLRASEAAGAVKVGSEEDVWSEEWSFPQGESAGGGQVRYRR